MPKGIDSDKLLVLGAVILGVGIIVLVYKTESDIVSGVQAIGQGAKDAASGAYEGVTSGYDAMKRYVSGIFSFGGSSDPAVAAGAAIVSENGIQQAYWETGNEGPFL